MESIFDAKITREEFNALFKDACFTYDNYQTFPENRINKKYHLAMLMFLRGNEEEGKKYLDESGVPIGQIIDYAG